eukprot:TRINITY_DN3764_c0_g1_i1.p1 TRINITY_DN3764_c0_g1~~TRINITY_DN3764_c0_g1_i1.p1  ORF type:complete len:153 (-),score=11.70 TRINITY_DN3764_c0_g1_i1:854-1312(-)
MNHLTLISLFLMFYLTTFTASLPLENSKHLYQLTDNNLEPYGIRGILFKRNPEMDTDGFYGDTFDSGFGDFYPSKRTNPSKLTMTPGRYLVHKRLFSGPKGKRLTSNNNGFYGDTFSDGFGDFSTTKKRSLSSLNTFHGDTFSQGFGDFQTV